MASASLPPGWSAKGSPRARGYCKSRRVWQGHAVGEAALGADLRGCRRVGCLQLAGQQRQQPAGPAKPAGRRPQLGRPCRCCCCPCSCCRCSRCCCSCSCSSCWPCSCCCCCQRWWGRCCCWCCAAQAVGKGQQRARRAGAGGMVVGKRLQHVRSLRGQGVIGKWKFIATSAFTFSTQLLAPKHNTPAALCGAAAQHAR